MASNNTTLYANLSKVYIPAASLNKSKPEELTIPELVLDSMSEGIS